METITIKREIEVLKCRSYKVELIWNITCHFGLISLYNAKNELLVRNECTKKVTLDSYKMIVDECLKDKSLSLIARIRDCE